MICRLSFRREGYSLAVSRVFLPLSLLMLGVLGDFPAFGQGNLRDSLEQLDTNENGEIDPDEITPLARPYLERIAETKRLSLRRSNEISELQEAARIYYALKNGVSGSSVRPSREPTVSRFEPDDEMELVPEFGLADVKYPYTMDDVEEAEDTIRRCDRNDDGFVDRREARRNRWTHRDPFEMDLNQDGLLSRMELIQRYARRRLLDGDAQELVQRARRIGNGIEPSRSSRDERDSRENSSWWRRGGSSYWLAASLLGRFDSNRNGRLEKVEALELGIPMGLLDINRDSEISRDELQAYTSSVQAEEGDPNDALPGWFYELDVDRDGQVSMPEFTQEWTETKILEFTNLDANEDGLLTASEIQNSKSMVGGTFANEVAEVIPPRKTVISEIDVPDDLIIGDLNVEISITHTYIGYLDVYLTGPDGQRIELFTEVGGSGDHFENTIFDDQAGTPIVKGRPPYKDNFQPEALTKRQPSLSYYNGKSAKGVWQLVVRATRSDRFGMLHSWKILCRTKDSMVGEQYLTSNASTSLETGASEVQASETSRSFESESRDRQEYRSEDERRQEKARAAGERWIQSAGTPEEQEKRRGQLARYQAYVERMKAEGREVTGAEKMKFFSDGKRKEKLDPGDKEKPKIRYSKSRGG